MVAPTANPTRTGDLRQGRERLAYCLVFPIPIPQNTPAGPSSDTLPRGAGAISVRP